MNVETFDVSMGDRCGPVVSQGSAANGYSLIS
jgi:hypothetical protein